MPGGGLANLEIFQRFTQSKDLVNICLMAEGTFHQYHQGVATSNIKYFNMANMEYSKIMNVEFAPKEYNKLYFKL